jgi:hypothetical protein
MKVTGKYKKLLKYLDKKPDKGQLYSIETFFGDGNLKYEKSSEFVKIVEELKEKKYIETQGGGNISPVYFIGDKYEYTDIKARITLDGEDILKSSRYIGTTISVSLLILAILSFLFGQNQCGDNNDNNSHISKFKDTIFVSSPDTIIEEAIINSNKDSTEEKLYLSSFKTKQLFQGNIFITCMTQIDVVNQSVTIKIHSPQKDVKIYKGISVGDKVNYGQYEIYLTGIEKTFTSYDLELLVKRTAILTTK